MLALLSCRIRGRFLWVEEAYAWSLRIYGFCVAIWFYIDFFAAFAARGRGCVWEHVDTKTGLAETGQ